MGVKGKCFFFNSGTKLRKNEKEWKTDVSVSREPFPATGCREFLGTRASDRACLAWGEAVACLASSELHRHFLFEGPGPGPLQHDPHTFPWNELTDLVPARCAGPVQSRAFTGPFSPQLRRRGAQAGTQAGQTGIATGCDGIGALPHWWGNDATPSPLACLG